MQREIPDPERGAKRPGSARETGGESTRGGQVFGVGVVRELASDVGDQLQRAMELDARFGELRGRDVRRAFPAASDLPLDLLRIHALASGAGNLALAKANEQRIHSRSGRACTSVAPAIASARWISHSCARTPFTVATR